MRYKFRSMLNRILPILLSIILALNGISAQVQQEWIHHYDYSLEGEEGVFISPAPNNDFVYYTIHTEVNLDQDFIVIKLNDLGNEEWVNIFAGPSMYDDQINDIVLDTSDNGLWIVGEGSFSGNDPSQLAIKYDQDGEIIAQHNFDTNLPGEGDFFNVISMDERGNVYCSGDVFADSSTLFSYNRLGEEKWIAKSSNNLAVNMNHIAIKDNIIILSGQENRIDSTLAILSAFDTLGNNIWNFRYTEFPLFPTNFISDIFIDINNSLIFTRGGVHQDSAFCKLSTINTLTGSLVSEYDCIEMIDGFNHTINKQGIFFNKQDNITKLNLQGEIDWHTNLYPNIGDSTTSNFVKTELFIDTNFIIFTANLTGELGSVLNIIDAESGSVLWDTTITDTKISNVHLNNNILYLTGNTIICPENSQGCSFLAKYNLSSLFDTTTAIESINQIKFISIYPNPASTQITFQFNLLEKKERLLLYNSLGQLVKTINVSPNTKEQIVDISSLSKGIYLWRMSNGKSGKFVVE